jgi:Zn-dependent protease with chaperone function
MQRAFGPLRLNPRVRPGRKAARMNSHLGPHPDASSFFSAGAQSAPRLAAAGALAPSGGPVDVRSCIEPRTGLALAGASVMLVLGLALLVLTVYGIALVGVLALVNWFVLRRARVLLSASSLRVGPRQFAEIHACATDFGRRLGLTEVPEIYVVDTSEVNAFALRFGRKNVVVLTDEAVAACLEGKSPGALAFVIGHELAHVALGHHRWLRACLRRLRRLSRLDEFSADRVASELVGTREAAEDGVLLLCAGPRLLSFVDRAAARAQASEVVADRATAKAERVLTHPTALRRLDRVQRHFGAERARRAA